MASGDVDRIHSNGKRFIDSRAWPPKRPDAGDRLFGIGFPAESVIMTSDGLDFAIDPVMAVVSHVGFDCIWLRDDEGHRVGQSLTAQRPDAKHTWGGMSGGPYFLNPADEPDSFRLVGFAQEVGDYVDSSEDGHTIGNDGLSQTVRVSHANHISNDGTIRLEQRPLPRSSHS